MPYFKSETGAKGKVFKLALKNLKQFKTVAIIIAIAISIAVLFCVFAFEGTVGNYLLAIEKAETGDSDLVITPRSDSASITSVAPLKGLDGVEYAVGAVVLYGSYGDNYLSLYGFDGSDIQTLNLLDVVYGSVSDLVSKSENVAVSEDMANNLSLKIGDKITVSVFNRSKDFYVSAICKNNGYFAFDSPYKVIGLARGGISSLIGSSFGNVYNKIYVKAKSGTGVAELIDTIKSMPEYENMNVVQSVDTTLIAQQTRSYSASIIISGVAVVLLVAGAIAVLFLLTTEQKRALISKLTTIGASRKQIFRLFFAETAVLALGGFALGLCLSPLLLYILLSVTIGATNVYFVNAGLLIGAAFAVAVFAVFVGLIPYFIALRKSAKENLVQTAKSGRLQIVAAAISAALCVLCSVLTFTLPQATARGVFGILNVVFVALAACLVSPYMVKGLGKACSFSKNPSVAVAGEALSKHKSVSRSSRLITLGVVVSVLLTMAWSVSKSVFSGFKDQYTSLVFVSNVSSETDDDFNEIASFDGVMSAHKALWFEAGMTVGKENKTVNVIGVDDVLDIIDFRYITAKSEIEKKLSENTNYCFIDEAYQILYSLDVGDKVTVQYESKTATFTVGGILRQELFGGAYLVVSRQVLSDAFSLPSYDSVVAVSDSADSLARQMQQAFSSKNLFVLTALETFSWETDSFDKIFDLIGVLAIVFILATVGALLINVYIARSSRRIERSRLLLMGMEKNTLLLSEFFEHFIVAAVAFVLTVALSALHVASLIHALLLFDLYFEFYYVFWVVAVTSLAMLVFYIFVPFIFAFKKRYKIELK